jgi:hypothetical protein
MPIQLTVALFLFAAPAPIACPVESNHKPLASTSVIELLNGSEGDLAPDDENRKVDSVIQLWKLEPAAGARILLRCTYRDTKESITRELPKEFRLCTKNLTYSGKGPVSIVCK